MSYKKGIKRLASIALATGLIIPSFQSDEVFAAEESKKINILHTNDVHGRYVKDSNSIGVDVLSTIKKETPNSILVDAGDAIHGLPFVTLSRGEDAIELMDAAGYDFMVPGNHDFNYGYERLLELTKQIELKPGTQKLRVLSSNVKKDGKSVFTPSYIKEVNGVKVGFFGISTEETAYKTNPNNVKGLKFTNPIDSAKEEVKNLKSNGAEVIVGLSHVGTDEESSPTTYDVAKSVDDIDVIIDGHSHTDMLNGEKINDTLIVSAGSYMQKIGRVEIEVSNKNGKYEVVNSKGSQINKSDTLNIKGDEEIENKINEIKTSQESILSVKVGETSSDLDGLRENVRTKETNLGNLLTDAMIDETGADVAITNGGGIRDSIKVGDITRGDITKVLPFGNFTITKELTGDQIKQVLEHGVKDFGTSAGSFAHVGGIKFVVDPTEKIGSRVSDITIKGNKIDLNKRYIVATNDFLAVGGDEYPCFSNEPTLNEYGALDETLEKYIKKIGKVDYKVEGRITSSVDMLVGNTRYETATKISEKAFDKSDNAIIVNSEASADALCATPFAKMKNSPILLTSDKKLDNSTKKELERLEVKNVYIIGGINVIPESIIKELKDINITVERISGNSRYETSLEVANRLGDISEIAVVNGETGLSDAVSIAPIAASKNMPIILSSPKLGTNVFDKFIKENNISKSYIIGKESAVSNEIANKLPNTKRLGGLNRNETNAVVIEEFYESETLKNVYVAKDGMNKKDDLIDALAVGVLAAKEESPIVIVGNKLNEKQKNILSSKKANMVTQIGGNGNEDALKEVKNSLKK